MQPIKTQKIRLKLKSHNEGKLRLSVERSNRGFYAQVIDDTKGNTLVSVNSKEASKGKLTKTEQATKTGELLAKKAKDKKITSVYFDRKSYKFHGRVKAFASAARDGGLKF